MSSLRDTLQDVQIAAGVARPAVAGEAAGSAYRKIASELHRQLLDRIDLDVMGKLPPDRLREELRLLVEKMIGEAGLALNANERKQIVADVQNEVMGLGPLESLLADPTVSDILVNTYQTVYVERRGQLERTDVRFASDDHLMKIIDKIVSRVGRRIDESSPMVDARLPDGSRVNAIIPPLAIDGPLLSIRRFAVVPLKADDLIRFKSMTPQLSELLGAMVKAKLNILISGGTGSGKTTLLNILSAFIPPKERIVTIEDAAELQLQQPHVVRLETRPPNIEGRGEITQRSLVRNSLRMRPDRIILGEVRGAETFDMLQAMNTGHEGSMATVHANTPRDALTRLENMLGMAGMTMPPKAMRQQIASALTAVVQVSRLSDGKRKIVSLSEITGMEGDIITMQEIFVFQQTGIGPDGAVLGHFKATGVRPKFLERIRAFGIALPDALFDPSRIYE
ncbi:CpaF family protein [Burkholderiaceae bacterium FT117]|uniref:CpaF family protein n=1 Tax=Zeimonas sediminis TaxID=2944268 RepID=UPI0023431914|nr:CpaF family protein [Zeimonas sediminis]MCM5572079.1 CpaF family protein [Zeimonas sediminis]